MIECIDLTRAYGSYTAVDHLNLNVHAGELFGFVGPNGAGKTTTIKLLTGLLVPDSGSAIIGGFDIVLEPLKAKQIIGYVPDNPFLYDKLTGKEMLEFTSDLWLVDAVKRDRKITDLLKLFDLTDKGDQLIHGYSRGMRQKLTLACALIHQPKIIILDEPTVGLDPRGARLLKQTLQELSSRGSTVFVSTHILEAAEEMCTRIGVFYAGKLIALGTMEELRYSDEKESLESIFMKLTGENEDENLMRLLD